MIIAFYFWKVKYERRLCLVVLKLFMVLRFVTHGRENNAILPPEDMHYVMVCNCEPLVC